MFPNAPVIETSHNYDLFKKIEWNRSVDKGNLVKLIQENRDNFQLHRFPILVTEDMKIIDGQHRYECAKELGSPVYYIRQGRDDSFKAVHSVNKTGKKHTVKDKLEMLYKAGDEGAITVYKVAALYGNKFDLATILSVLSTGADSGDNKKIIDNDGAIILRNYDKGIEVLDALHYGVIPEKYKARIVLALSQISRKSGVHPKAITKRVELYPSKWVKPLSRQEAVRSFQTCYNWQLTEKNRI